MRLRSIFVWLGIMVALVAINILVGFFITMDEPSSDQRNLWWDRFDVRIDNLNTATNQFDVTETYQLTIERGPYRYGTAAIPMKRLQNIEIKHFEQDGRALSVGCHYEAGTYCAQREGDDFNLKYWFWNQLSSGATTTVEFTYTVTGALRSYADGDELFWGALPGDLFGFDVLASRVTLVMPAGMDVIDATSYPDTWHQTTETNTLTWVSPPKPSDDGLFEIRVKYPHDPAMQKPSWQTRYDLDVIYKDNIQPVISLILAALAGLLAITGSLWVVLHYLREGRDPATIVVPEYLTEPPGGDPPGIVGLLVDEKADMRDIMATFIDLARRGYFAIEQTQSTTLGVFKNTEFTFHKNDKAWNDVADYENTILQGLFPGGRTETTLDDLKEKFYTRIDGIKQSMYNTLVTSRYFTRSPEDTRNRWMFRGIVLLVLGSAGFWVSHIYLRSISPLIFLPPVALVVIGAFMTLFSDVMPAKTEKGAQQAALWRAFQRYLANLDRYSVENAAQRFEEYMPFAVAFGLEKEFVKETTPKLTAMPVWYYPTYLGGPWHGGYRRGHHPGGGVPGGIGGPGGLSGLDRSLSEGLNSLSSGMTQMLNEASKVMTSRPKSSGSGGGGFSGGGAGGSSGGGSRGFG